MSALLALDVSPGTSALERLLAVVRRRGFRVDSLQAVRSSEDRRCLSVELNVSGSRDVAVLGRQLANLGDCRRIVVRSASAGADAAPPAIAGGAS